MRIRTVLVLPLLTAALTAQLPGPSAEAKSLQRLVGHWSGEGVSRPGPGAEPVPWQASMVAESLFGGFFVREELEIRVGAPTPLRMTTIFGHDRSHDELCMVRLMNSGDAARTVLQWVDENTLVACGQSRYRGELVVGRSTWTFTEDGYGYVHQTALGAGEWFTEVEGSFERDPDAQVAGDAGAFMNAPVPEPMERLDGLLGSFRLEGTMQMPGAEPVQVAGDETVRPIHGGQVLESRAKSDPMPDTGVWQGLSFYAWDAARGHYRTLMLDSLGEFAWMPMWWVGEDTLVTIDARPMMGEPAVQRTVVQLTDGRMSGFESHMISGTGAPFRSFVAEYRPKTDD